MSVRFGDLKKDLLAFMGCMEREGTASSGSGSTLVDAGILTDDDDFFKGWRVYVHNGTAQGDERKITASSAAAASVTVSPGFSVTPDATSEYYIYDTYRNVTVERAVKMALKLLRHQFLLRAEDQTTVLTNTGVAADYEIAVPAGFVSVREIWREDATGFYPIYLPGPGDSQTPIWTIHGDSTGRKIKLDKAQCGAILVAGKHLRIIGQKYQAEPSSDDSTFDMNTGPLVVLAAAILRLEAIKEVNQIEPTRASFQRALESIGLGWGYEQGCVIVEEA
jgi:hypothetical protein